jgi:hypothetical protein
MMTAATMESTIETILASGKRILAANESILNRREE